MSSPSYKYLTITSHPPDVYAITLHKPPENRITTAFAQEIIRALRDIERRIGPNASGAVIIKGSDQKFWCTGLDLDESESNPHSNSDGFYPLVATLLDYPFPTIALLTGHTFGGAVPFALSCDYRIMNSKRGFISMPPVNLGLHFDGIGALPRLKLAPRIARKMLLEAHKWTGKAALEDGIVDEIAEPDEMDARAIEVARTHAGRAKMGVYAVLRAELWAEAAEKFRRISYVHGRPTATPAKAKI
jgi:Delta3-Delta2-enoyl-CoA isomerase